MTKPTNDSKPQAAESPNSKEESQNTSKGSQTSWPLDDYRIISDPNAPELEVFMGLADQQLRQLREAPGGDMQGVFIAEGDLVIARALKAGHRLLKVFVEAARSRPLEFDPGQAPVLRGGEPVVNAIASNRRYRGSMACFARPARKSPQELFTTAPFVSKNTGQAKNEREAKKAGETDHREAAPKSLATSSAENLGQSSFQIPKGLTVLVTEGVNNPTNMGVMIRTATGLGIDALLADKTSCDPLARRACRVSMGTVFSLPFAHIDTIEDLKIPGLITVAMTPGKNAVPIQDLDIPADQSVALVVGAEGPGLKPETINACDIACQIPMHAQVDSLNVATAAAITMWAIKQR